MTDGPTSVLHISDLKEKVTAVCMNMNMYITRLRQVMLPEWKNIAVFSKFYKKETFRKA